MKNILLLCLILVSMVGCSQSEPIYHYGMLDVESTYETLDEIKKDSALIVRAKLQGESEKISFGNEEFTKTSFTVKKVYKGDSDLTNSSVDVLELSMLSTAKDRGNGQFLLFLKPYEGPVTTNAFVITGVYQGRFKISNEGNLLYDAERYDGISKFQKEFINTPVDRLSDKL